MPLPELPIEVWENVIDQLQDERRALLSCTRVCRAWAPRSLLHLRRWLILRRPRRVARLAKLVRGGSWEVKSYRTLIITSASLRTVGLLAAMFAGRMPRLEELVMHGLRLRRSIWQPEKMHVDVFLHLSTFNSITLLDLVCVTFPSVQTFGRLISALPGLSNLRCAEIEFEARNLRLSAFLRRPRNLATLYLEIDDLPTMHDISRLLFGTEMASTLKEITSRTSIPLPDLQKSGISALVSSAGAHLLSLDLSLEDDIRAGGEPVPKFDFSNLVNLQHARFMIKHRPHRNEASYYWILWLCHQLQSYPKSSTALRTLSIHFCPYYSATHPENADNLGFNAGTCKLLDDALSIQLITSLKEVSLRFEIPGFTAATSAEWSRFIPEVTQFPNLAARGILRIETISHSGRKTTAGGHR